MTNEQRGSRLQLILENQRLRVMARQAIVASVTVCLLTSTLCAGAAFRAQATYKELSASAQTVAEAAQADAAIWRQTAERYKAEAEIATKEAQLVGAEYVGEFMATAYCTEKYEHICGEGHGITKSGQPVQAGVTVAADPSILPLGTVIYIEGVGIRIVQDTGGAIKGNRIDVAIDTHENALKWTGYGTHAVYIISTPEEVNA